MQENRKLNTKTLAVCAMLCAMAYALTAVSHFLLPPLLPAAAWLKYDPKDVILAIGGLLLGPVPALCVTLVTSLLEMLTFSETGWIGLVMNVVQSGAFILPAALLYSRRRNLASAVTGLLCGVVFMTGMMLLWNAFLTPLYMGAPRDVVIGMLVPVFLPFNAIKGGLNAAITLLLYKPLTRALRAAKLLPAQTADKQKGFTLVSLLIAAVIAGVCIAVLLVLRRG
jgi:riboflavin transporter FmnP